MKQSLEMFCNYLLMKVITHYNVQDFQKDNQQIKLLITKIVNVAAGADFEDVPCSAFSEAGKQTVVVVIFQRVLKIRVIVVNAVLVSERFVRFFKECVLS